MIETKFINYKCLHMKLQVTYVKMDCEGAEIEILETVSDWKNVSRLVFEYRLSTPQFRVQVISTSIFSRRGNNVKGMKNFHLKAKARI